MPPAAMENMEPQAAAKRSMSSVCLGDAHRTKPLAPRRTSSVAVFPTKMSSVSRPLVVTRRPSAISLERHGSVVFDQLLQDLDDDSVGSNQSSRIDEELLIKEIQSTTGSSDMARCTSEISIDSLEDNRPKSEDAHRSPKEKCGPRPRTTLISSIEEDVIQKAIAAGKLVRRASQASVGSMRRRLSFNVICEDREHKEEDDLIVSWPDQSENENFGIIAEVDGEDMFHVDLAGEEHTTADSLTPFGSLPPLLKRRKAN